MKIGEKIAKLLKDKGWSAYRLHKESGIPQPTIGRYISGENIPSGEMLQKIAGTLGVSMAEFDDKPSGQNLVSKYKAMQQKQAELSDKPAIDQVLARAEHYNLQGEYKEALEKIKAMQPEEKAAQLDEVYEQFKKLSPEEREALMVIMRSMKKE